MGFDESMLFVKLEQAGRSRSQPGLRSPYGRFASPPPSTASLRTPNHAADARIRNQSAHKSSPAASLRASFGYARPPSPASPLHGFSRRSRRRPARMAA